MSNQLIAVVGPTGSGKTALAVKLAKKYNGVLVSADSRQVYRGLDVGTNKEGVMGQWQGVAARIIDGVPQLLIDVFEPGQRFTLNDWLEQARTLLLKVWVAGQLPIVVGGTGLYVSALVEGYQLGRGRGAKLKKPVDFEALLLQPDVERDILYQKSDQRCQQIFDALVSETKDLITAGVSAEWLEKIGLDYRFASYFITGKMARETAISEFQKASRAYIRRQLTWWRHHNDPILVASYNVAEQKVAKFLKTNTNPVL